MRARLLLPVLLLSFLGAAPAPQERVYSGYYTIGWEEQSFRPCTRGASAAGERGPWWVSNPGPMSAAYAELVEPMYGTIFVTVRMDLTSRGQWGHMGQYTRAVAVTELIDARLPSRERDDCTRTRDTE